MAKKIFVTVGTTKFPELVLLCLSEEFQQKAFEDGFTDMVIQYGKVPPAVQKNNLLKVETFDFAGTLTDEMQLSDLVISHAGAGSIIEALRLKKRLIVVVNEALMDNHQVELANALGERGFLINTTVTRLLLTMSAVKNFNPVPYPDKDLSKFHSTLEELFGVPSS
eukprot:Filipodium_phascolosomae@DN3928_c0_g1_i1.p1